MPGALESLTLELGGLRVTDAFAEALAERRAQLPELQQGLALGWQGSESHGIPTGPFKFHH